MTLLTLDRDVDFHVRDIIWANVLTANIHGIHALLKRDPFEDDSISMRLPSTIRHAVLKLSMKSATKITISIILPTEYFVNWDQARSKI